MTKFRYKSTSDTDTTLIGYGIVAAGEVIETDEQLVNPNLESLPAKKSAKKTLNKDDDDGSRD